MSDSIEIESKSENKDLFTMGTKLCLCGCGCGLSEPVKKEEVKQAEPVRKDS